MRAIVIERNGGPEVLEPRDRPEPEPGPGELLVALEAAGVNFRDVYERRGGYGTPPPLVAGAEGAGTVAATGPGGPGSGRASGWPGRAPPGAMRSG